MGKDTTAFRKRFEDYKNGKSVSEIYDAGLPKYAGGNLPDWLPDYTMDYILALENPLNIGLQSGIWRPPTDSSRWDTHAIGGGLDIRYENNPYVYNFLSKNGRLNDPYLTTLEEEMLRMQTFNASMLPALTKMYNKYGDRISGKGYARLAGMKWQGHPYLMAITPDSITGKAFLNAIASGDRDLDSVFDAYYLYPTNAEKYASRIQSDKNYWKDNQSEKLQLDVPKYTVKYHEEIPDRTAVRKTIPESEKRARWSGAEEVSPYITGRPMLKLQKEVKLPNVIEENKKSLWKPKMLFKDGKLPGYKNGKGDGTRYLWDQENKEWDRISNDEYARAFADLTVVPEKSGGNRLDIRTNPIYHDPGLRSAGYVTQKMLEDEVNATMLRETGSYAPGLELVNPEFDLLFMGAGSRINPLTQRLHQTRSLAKQMDRVFDEGLVGATKDMPVFKASDMYNPEHFRSTVKYNPKQIEVKAKAGNEKRASSNISEEQVLNTPKRGELISPQKLLENKKTQSVLDFPDPYADLYNTSAGQEVASPELASTLYPRSKYTLLDVPSKLITTYDEIPNRHTGNNASSIVNSLYDAYSKALSGYLKYGINPPLPYIVSVGDDAVKVGFENAFYNMAYMPASVQHTIEMPKGITNKLALLMLADYPEQQQYLIQSWPERYKPAAKLLGISTQTGVMPPRALGADRDVDDIFDDFIDAYNGYIDHPVTFENVNHAMPLAADQETRDAVDKVRGLIQDRDIFKSNIWSYVPSYNLSNRYARIISNAENPEKYITDNFAKLILRGAKDNYFKQIKKYKQKDYARRIKAVEKLNADDTRFEVSDDNRDRLQDAVSLPKSLNTDIQDSKVLSNIIGNVGSYFENLSKNWQTLNLSPNRPGWMLKSLMEGNTLEKQLSKDGMISVTNIQNHIKKGSDVEKYIVDKVLNDKFAGLGKINYTDFKHAVQDELISYRHNPDDRWASYGAERLRVPGYRTDELRQMMFNMGWNESDIAHGLSPKSKLDTYTFSSPRIEKGNSKHYDNNTLGHSRTYTRTDDPGVMYVMESQSDWGQARYYDENGNSYNKTMWDFEYPDRANDADRKIARDREKQFLNDHEIYLKDNFERRLIQENLLHASRKGYNKMRYPTAETAAKIENYNKLSGLSQEYHDALLEYEKVLSSAPGPIENFPEELKAKLQEVENKLADIQIAGRDIDYRKEHRTILSKYKNFPKLYKKLYKDARIDIVTDAEGNTWYEVDVPKNMRRKELMYSISLPPVIAFGLAGYQTQKQH